MQTLKLPLFLHEPHMCDPDFDDNHSYVIKKVQKDGGIVAECTGCGIEWQGNFKKHWIPRSVAKVLKESHTDKEGQ